MSIKDLANRMMGGAPTTNGATGMSLSSGGYLVDIGGVTTVCTDLEKIHQLVSSAVGAAVLANTEVVRRKASERTQS